jgi:fatty acid-binding protein DegV
MKIVTDCAADMPAEELEQLGVTLAPLFIQFPEGEVNCLQKSIARSRRWRKISCPSTSRRG